MVQTSLRDVLMARRRHWQVRVAASLTMIPAYGPLLGWGWAVPVSGSYLVLQFIERFWLPRLVAAPEAERGWTRGAVLALLALGSLSFCLPSLPLAARLGGWGMVCAVYVAVGVIINAALTTVGCRAAFLATALPGITYAASLPFIAVWCGQPPPQLLLQAVLTLALGGGFLSFNVWQLWSRGTQGKTAEIQAARLYVARRDETEAKLYRLTQLDTLTGLLNRDVLQERLAGMVVDGTPGALLLIDLDGFKYVNDTMGHAMGDAVLRTVAARLHAAARQGDTAARLGGDEFALLLSGVTDTAMAVAVAERLIADISQPLQIEGLPINIGASIGIALHPLHGREPGQIFSNADLALYGAKAEGRHCARLYNAGLREAAQGKVLRDSELRLAMEQGEFEMFYQPQIRLRDGALTGAEALLRWRHPRQGLLAPASFLPALEGGLLSAQVGAWVIETACTQAAAWRAGFAPGFRIGVNLFGAQFRAGNLVEWVNAALAKSSLPPEGLEIEITENIILRHEDEVIAPLRQLRASGIGVAFDDYGTGFASLSMLTRYPVSRLKIDRAFTQVVCDSTAEAAIMRAIIRLGHALGLTVTAEGVESAHQLAWLRGEGCDEGQGYLFGKPMSAAAFQARFGGQMGAVEANLVRPTP